MTVCRVAALSHLKKRLCIGTSMNFPSIVAERLVDSMVCIIIPFSSILIVLMRTHIQIQCDIGIANWLRKQSNRALRDHEDFDTLS